MACTLTRDTSQFFEKRLSIRKFGLPLDSMVQRA
jgi:hypothetical protein